MLGSTFRILGKKKFFFKMADRGKNNNLFLIKEHARLMYIIGIEGNGHFPNHVALRIDYCDER